MLLKRKIMIVNDQKIWNSEWESTYEINEELVKEVENWLRDNLVLQKGTNYNHTSYGLKHIVERDIGKYVCNVDVKIAMARLGIKGRLGNKTCWNYSYPIHEVFFHYYYYKRDPTWDPYKKARIKKYLSLRGIKQ